MWIFLCIDSGKTFQTYEFIRRILQLFHGISAREILEEKGIRAPGTKWFRKMRFQAGGGIGGAP